MVPLSPAEVEWYRTYAGGIGSQILRSSGKGNKRRHSVDFGDINEEPLVKRSRDVGLVVEHCASKQYIAYLLYKFQLTVASFLPIVTRRQRKARGRRGQTKRVTDYWFEEFQ